MIAARFAREYMEAAQDDYSRARQSAALFDRVGARELSSETFWLRMFDEDLRRAYKFAALAVR